MGLGGILILLLLLVSLIVFIYVIVVTARGWGVLHTILLCTLFIECWVFIAFSAGVHYRRVRSTEAAFKARVAAETAEAQTMNLLWGNFEASSEALDAVVPVQGQLRRLTADRGRVWRQLNLLQSTPTGYELQLSSADAGQDALTEEVDPAVAVAAAQPTSESLPVETVVYAFAEEMNEEGQPIPVYYLGEFTVTQSQAGQVTLEPTLQLYADQAERISSGSATTWTLYELLPLDSHTAFAAPGSQPTDEQLFGRMDEETITSMFAGVPTDDNRQQQMIDAYLRDGKRSENDPIEDVWVQVNVLKDYEIDVDSQEIANATERGYFDTIGRSVDSRLKRSGEGEDGRVKLTPDMKDKLIILKEEAARPLIDSGVVELVQRIYVRRLNDYEEAFNQHVVRSHEVSESIALFQRDSQEISKANQLGQEMISFRQVENQELQSDLGNYQREITVLNAAVSDATGKLNQLKSDLSRMYRSVQARRDQLAEPAVVAPVGG